jgi:hypothetical protein
MLSIVHSERLLHKKKKKKRKEFVTKIKSLRLKAKKKYICGSKSR